MFLLLLQEESSKTIQTQSGQGGYGVFILKSSLYFTVKTMSQPVWSVHVLKSSSMDSDQGKLAGGGSLKLQALVLFLRTAESETVPRAEGIPGITLSVLWFIPLCVKTISPCPQSCPCSLWGSPGSLPCHPNPRAAGKGEDLGTLRGGRFAAPVGCNCNNLTVTGKEHWDIKAEDVSDNPFYK